MQTQSTTSLANPAITSQQIFSVISELKGKKATILKYSEMGFIHSIQCTIGDVYMKDYAQYKNLLHVTFQPKGKISMYIWQLFDYQNFALFAGHVELKTDMFVSVNVAEDGTKTKRSLLSFSIEYLEIALRSTNQTPVLVQRRD